jgi:hypothetical protein
MVLVTFKIAGVFDDFKNFKEFGFINTTLFIRVYKFKFLSETLRLDRCFGIDD